MSYLKKLSDEIAPYFRENFDDWSTVHQIDYGGRGSTKSTKNAKKLVLKWKRNKDMHIVVVRKYSDNHKDSTLMAILKQLNWLNMQENVHYKYTVRPAHIKNLITGQNIYFRGLDDFDKIKGLEVPFGFIGAVWFFEITEFRESRDIGEVIATFARGVNTEKGQFFIASYEYNPSPKPTHWTYEWSKSMEKRPDAYVTRTNWEMLPTELAEKWLGKIWINEAKMTKEINPNLYKNQYLGLKIILSGGIYTSFSEKNIDTILLKKYKFLNVAVDYGESDATTFVVNGVTQDMRLEFFREYYHKNNVSPVLKNINEYVDDCYNFLKNIIKDYPSTTIKLFIDSHELSFFNLIRPKIISNRMPVLIKKVNKKRTLTNESSQISERIKTTNILFKLGVITIDKSCKMLIDAIQDCIYKPNSDVHLDNGTSNIDSIDSFHYSILDIMHLVKKIAMRGDVK